MTDALDLIDAISAGQARETLLFRGAVVSAVGTIFGDKKQKDEFADVLTEIADSMFEADSNDKAPYIADAYDDLKQAFPWMGKSKRNAK